MEGSQLQGSSFMYPVESQDCMPVKTLLVHSLSALAEKQDMVGGDHPPDLQKILLEDANGFPNFEGILSDELRPKPDVLLYKCSLCEEKHEQSMDSPPSESSKDDSYYGNQESKKKTIDQVLTPEERVQDFGLKYEVEEQRIEELEVKMEDLSKKVTKLEHKLDTQDLQLFDVEEKQLEEERVLLGPMRNIYLRQFQDQARDRISKKMHRSSVYSEHHRSLKSRICQHDTLIREALEPFLAGDLWKLIQEANSIAPKFFSKASLWNKFVDSMLEDDKHLEAAGLSADAVLLTRYARGPDQEPNISDVHLKNKLIFGELVSGQDDETRPLYSELYEFLYNVSPESMHLKGESDMPD